MNRREFTTGLAAASAAPALPLKAAAAAIAPAPAAAAVAGNFTPYAYTCALHYAQMMGSSSPELLVREFGISASSARAITSRLIKKGVLLAPNAIGVSRATNAVTPPAPAAPRPVQAAGAKTAASGAKAPDMRKMAKEVLLDEDTPVEPLDHEPIQTDES